MALNRVDVDVMLESISIPAFFEWIEYNRIDPIGQDRLDLNAAIVASTVANANRGKRTRAFKPGDFMPEFDKRAKPVQSADKMWAALTAHARACNG